MPRDDLLQSPFQNGANEISIFSVSRARAGHTIFFMQKPNLVRTGVVQRSPLSQAGLLASIRIFILCSVRKVLSLQSQGIMRGTS